MLRYKEKIKKDGFEIFETHYIDSFELSDKDIYITSIAGQRFDELAFQYYNDQTLWWVIAKANNLINGTLVIPPGLKIRIPNPERINEIDEIIERTQFKT